jgi:hypothetical protein
MALKNKLINHIDKIKEIVLENELLKYAVKSLQKKLEEKNMQNQENKKEWKMNYGNTCNKSLQKKIKEKYLHNQMNTKKKVSFMNKGTYPFPHEPIVDRSYNNIPYGNKILRRNNPITHQIPRRNIRNFVRNVQASLESSQRQQPKQAHPKIFIILKKKKFI